MYVSRVSQLDSTLSLHELNNELISNIIHIQPIQDSESDTGHKVSHLKVPKSAVTS